MATRSWLVLGKAVRCGPAVAARLSAHRALVASTLAVLPTLDVDVDLVPAALSGLNNLCAFEEDAVCASLLEALEAPMAWAKAGTLTPPQDPFASLDKAMYFAKEMQEDTGDEKPAIVCMRLLALLAGRPPLFAQFQALESLQRRRQREPQYDSDMCRLETMTPTFVKIMHQLNAQCRASPSSHFAGPQGAPHAPINFGSTQQYPQSVAPSLRACANPSCGAVEVSKGRHKTCAACKTVAYCGAACQKANWKLHKPACKHASGAKGK